MTKPFDNVTRFIHGLDQHALPRILGIKANTIETCDTDISTVASQADILLVIDKSYALHFENEVNYKIGTPARILEYSVLSEKRLKLAVRSVLILLRPEADGPCMTGHLVRKRPDGVEYLHFSYDVIRIWEIPAEELFECGIGALPLAFIGAIEPEKLPDLLKRARARLKKETDPKTAGEVLSAIDILMGLRYSREVIMELFKGAQSMEESVTYQAIIEKGVLRGNATGELNEARAILEKLGTHLFGEPSVRVRAAIKKINSKERLEDLILRTQIVSNWSELMKI